MAPRYPVLLDLDGAPCLVVGGGSVAARKVRGLLDVGADVTVLAPVLGPELAGAADDLTWWPRTHVAGDAAGPWSFVVAATDAPEVNDAVVAEARGAGTWANHAGRPDGGPAALPAVHRQGPVTVAVATGGAHPGAAAALRDLAARAIGPEHVVALDLIAGLRADPDRPGDLRTRPDWRQVVDSGTLDLIRAGQLAEAKERLQACLSSSSD